MGGLIKQRIVRWASPTTVLGVNYFDYIDGLRGIAILMVLLVHTSQYLGSGGYASNQIATYVNSGARGVQLFFIISAFTLYNSYKNTNATMLSARRKFYIRRAFRILPFWWIICAAWFAYAAYFNHQLEWAALLASLTFTFGFFRFNPNFELVPGGWSLFVEETFYILFPKIYKKITSAYDAIGLIILLLVLSFVWELFASRFVTLNNDFIFLAPPSQWFTFGLGILCYFLLHNDKITSFINNIKYSILLDSIVVGLFFFFFSEYRIASFTLAALVIVSASKTTRVGSLVRKPFLRLFGKFAYSLYLLHFLILALIGPYIIKILSSNPLNFLSYELKLIAIFPIICIVLLCLAALSFHYIEKPCINDGKELIRKLEEKAVKQK